MREFLMYTDLRIFFYFSNPYHKTGHVFVIFSVGNMFFFFLCQMHVYIHTASLPLSLSTIHSLFAIYLAFNTNDSLTDRPTWNVHTKKRLVDGGASKWKKKNRREETRRDERRENHAMNEELLDGCYTY